MFPDVVTALRRSTIADLADVLLVAVILYTLFLLIKETRAYQLAIGIAVVGLLFLASIWARLVVSNWLIRNFVPYLIIALIILFQSEIRRFLTGVGSRTFRKPIALRSLQEKIDDLIVAVDYMSQKKIGALIAIEKEISLETFIDRGVRLDGVISKDLIVSIFFPHAPLHDGAVIIRGSNVKAAGCLLPLPPAHSLPPDFQTRTRHLAAIGLTQETDAAVIVVSEENGRVALAAKGTLKRMANPDELKDELLAYLRK